MDKLKVVVLAGGIGSERQISLQSGKCVCDALKHAGIDVVLADISPDDTRILDSGRADVFFVALHGQFGEDGKLQRILEDKSLVYTGSNSKASEIAFDKMLTKKVFAEAGILTPAAVGFDGDMNAEQLKAELSPGADKYVVKPPREGSSVGVSIVQGASAAIEAAWKCRQRFGDCMIEEFIQGCEITAGILCGKVLDLIEVRPKDGFYDYHSKYVDGQTEYLFDTLGEPSLVDKIQSMAWECFKALGCRHFGRVDFIVTADAKPYVLEINTIPGMTSHSLLPKAAAKKGITMAELCIKIIEEALAESPKIRIR